MHDAPLFSPRRLVNAARLWLYFTCIGEMTSSFAAFLAWYRRPEAAERAGKHF